MNPKPHSWIEAVFVSLYLWIIASCAFVLLAMISWAVITQSWILVIIFAFITTIVVVKWIMSA